MWVPVVVVVVVVVVKVAGSVHFGSWNFFVYSEQNLSTPNKICALWLKYLVFVTFGIFAFFVFCTPLLLYVYTFIFGEKKK